MKKLNEFLNILRESKEKKGFHTNIEEDTKSNNNFRKVLFTAEHIQLVLMSLKPNEDIGLEKHNVDQFFRVDSGSGEAIIDGHKYELKDGDAIIIPANSEHNITAGDEGLKLYTLYAPPHHKDGIVRKTKEDAENKPE